MLTQNTEMHYNLSDIFWAYLVTAFLRQLSQGKIKKRNDNTLVLNVYLIIQGTAFLGGKEEKQTLRNNET